MPPASTAAELLTGSTINVAGIAARIGYESEAAFSSAFKKMISVAPSAWRRATLEIARRLRGEAGCKCSACCMPAVEKMDDP
jgi:AraC-like DNA-binding protein